MSARNPKYKIPLNILLDEHTERMLAALAESLDRKKSVIAREGIRLHYAMRFEQKPTCADGQNCRFPQSHVYPAPIPDAAANPGPPTHASP